jgi:hypothetical protein
LEQELEANAKWVAETEARLHAELGRAVDALHHTEKELEERTAWALRLEEEGRRLETQLTLVRASRWVKLGRKVGLGPDLPFA